MSTCVGSDRRSAHASEDLQATPLTPLAGHKHSGFGVENGVAGLLEFTQPKAIHIPKS